MRKFLLTPLVHRYWRLALYLSLAGMIFSFFNQAQAIRAMERYSAGALAQAEVDADQLTPLLERYRQLLAQAQAYAQQGVDTAGLAEYRVQIREAFTERAYAQAESLLIETEKLLQDLLAKKQEADRLAAEAAAKAKIEEEARLAAELERRRQAERAAQAAAAVAKATPTPKPVAASVAAPTAPAPTVQSSGASTYETRTVDTSRGSFKVNMMTFDLGSGQVRMVTDTAADNDCKDDCPARSVMDYVKRNGGFAGINGTYFCPPDYSWCANESNSFFWKIYNSRLNRLINGSNGLGENDPFLTFGTDGRIHYYARWSDWARSGAAITAGINSKPALVYGGKNILNEASLDDKQRTAKISRAALGVKGQTLYVVIVWGATVTDLAATMEALGVDAAVNIDAGGSAAMVYDGAYKVGPGRSVPNAIVFVRQ